MFAKNQTLIVFIENEIRLCFKNRGHVVFHPRFFSKWPPFRGCWGFGPVFLHVVHSFIDVLGGLTNSLKNGPKCDFKRGAYLPPPTPSVRKKYPTQNRVKLQLVSINDIQQICLDWKFIFSTELLPVFVSWTRVSPFTYYYMVWYTISRVNQYEFC